LASILASMGTTEKALVSALTGVLIHDGVPARRIFDPAASAEGVNQKWIALRYGFRSAGCELLADDELRDLAPDFELHLNARELRSSIPAFAILAECGLVHPPNADHELLRQYRGLFTWNSELVERGLASKIHLAHPMGGSVIDGYRDRGQLLALIAANKSLPVREPKFDLYRERVRTIRWFEDNAPQDFVLYGYGWDKSPRLPTRLGGIVHQFERMLPWSPHWFPSWRGQLHDKREVLERARFSIVYENVSGLRGYITEKIFDAFCSGNVPVYWGADDVTTYIPHSCFIDRRTFDSHRDLYKYLKLMPESTFIRYQQDISEFLASDAARKFSTSTFAEVVSNKILAALARY